MQGAVSEYAGGAVQAVSLAILCSIGPDQISGHSRGLDAGSYRTAPRGFARMATSWETVR